MPLLSQKCCAPFVCLTIALSDLGWTITAAAPVCFCLRWLSSAGAGCCGFRLICIRLLLLLPRLCFVQQQRAWFAHFDEDGSGELSQAEVVRGLIKSFQLGSDLRTVQEMKDTVGVTLRLPSKKGSPVSFVFWTVRMSLAPRAGLTKE